MGAIQQTLAGIKQAASVDPDAQAFLTATGIVDATISSAINTLVVALKGYSIWTKYDAIYPMVGGTSVTQSYNLKNTATFRITWSGTITQNANGVTGNGSTGYGDTGWNQSTNGAQDDEHMSCYSRTDVASANYDMGLVTGGSVGTDFRIRSGSDTFLTKSQTATSNSPAGTNTSLGYFSANRTGSTGYRARQNGTSTAITQVSTVGLVPINLYILCRDIQGTGPFQFSARNYCFFAVGRGLDATQDGNAYTAIQAFQTTLSRQV